MLRLSKAGLACIAFLWVTQSGVVLGDAYPLMQYLNIQYSRNPSFHPNATELIYLNNASGVPQVWRIQEWGGYPSQVTFDTNGVDGAWWSPTDVKTMVISAAVGGSERSQLYLADPYGSVWQRLTNDDGAINTFGCWSRDGTRFAYASNTRNKKDFDIYEYSTEAKDVFKLYQGEGSCSAAEYSPDNRHVLIVRETSSANTDLLLYDRQNGKTKIITPHQGDIQYRSPVWDAEGKGFYLLTDVGREFIGIAYWPLKSDSFEWIETPDWDVEQFALSNNNQLLVWTVNEGGFSRFHLRNLKDGSEVKPHRLPAGVITGMVFSHDGSKLSFSFGSGNRPYDIWLYQPYADKLHQLTFSATGGIPAPTLRAPELIEYETFDGRKIPAFWYAPFQSKGKMPVIVAVHGGPESQAQPDISGIYQYFISRGFAVLEPNIRGSSGYGKTYMALDNVHKRGDAVRDIEYAARWLKARPDVDSSKLIVYGGSYGGYMALAQLTTYPDTWAAGVSVVGIANFVSFLENTGIYRRALREAEYGSLANDREFLTQISPLTYADRIKAPLFLIQGANDPRVPKSEADQIANAIRTRGGIVEYLLFNDEGHGLKKTHNRIVAYSAMVDFLQKHVLGK